jgi:ubiquitin-like-conjugating enzyme ATG3
MKKFIDRMDEHQKEGSGSAAGQPAGSTPGKKGSAGGRWGLGGMVRKVTGGSGVKKEEGKEKEVETEGEGEVRGLQVDFYLVIVSHHTIGCVLLKCQSR